MGARYQEAKDHNCSRQRGHQFEIIQDKHQRDLIRKTYPKMKAPLWRCQFCNKITQST